MPQLGETISASKLGKRGTNRWIWVRCLGCERERWVRNMGRIAKKCKSCALKDALRRLPAARIGSNNGNWKGGRFKATAGYILRRLEKDDFFFSMVSGKGYVPEHRLVMAQALKRCLLPWEVVHHKNGVKDDNRLENLQLLPQASLHVSDSLLKARVNRLQKENDLLKRALAARGDSLTRMGELISLLVPKQEVKAQ